MSKTVKLNLVYKTVNSKTIKDSILFKSDKSKTTDLNSLYDIAYDKIKEKIKNDIKWFRIETINISY